MRTLLVVVSVFILAGCLRARRAEQERWARESMQRMVGQPVAMSIQLWGVPQTQMQMGEGRVYQWESFGDVHSSAYASGYRNTADVSGRSWQEHCKRWVTTDARDIILTADCQGECRQ